MTNHLNLYRGYDQHEEWSSLVFARTANEARVIFWQEAPTDVRYLDARAIRLRGFLDQLRDCAEKEGAHLVDSPIACEACLEWGPFPINGDGVCQECEELR